MALQFLCVSEFKGGHKIQRNKKNMVWEVRLIWRHKKIERVRIKEVGGGGEY